MVIDHRALLVIAPAYILGCDSPGGAENDAALAEIAAPKLECAVDQVKVTGREIGATNASYVVEGCGKKGSLLCESPVKDCVFAGSR